MKSASVIILFIIAGLVGVFLGVTDNATEEVSHLSSGITGAVIGSEPTYNSIKKDNSIEGIHYCSFVFDYNDEAYVNKTSYKYKTLCNISEFPIIGDFLYNQYHVSLVESESSNFAAFYVGNGNIEINKKFKEAKNLDLYLAHEIAHSSTEGLNLPDWLSEGIAEYSAYRYYGTQFKLKRLKHEDILHWNPSGSQTDIGDNIRGYSHSAYIVRKFVDTYGDEALKELIIGLNNKIYYEDTIDIKNKKILEVMQEITGNTNLTLEEVID